MKAQPELSLLILGGEGFIGRNLANFFSSSYLCYSVGVARSLFGERNDTFIQADPYQEKIPQSAHIVIHLIDNKEEGEDFLAAERRLLENIHLTKETHLIIFSSAVVYVNPDSPYGQRKQALEKLYLQHCKEREIPLTIFRLFNTYGPYQLPYRQGSLVTNILYNFLNQKTTEINDMSAERDFLYAGDIGKFVEEAIQNSLTGTFDLGTGRLTSISELIKILENNILEEKVPFVDNKKLEDIPPRAAEQDIVDLKNMVELSEGLLQTSAFYRENNALIRKYTEISTV